MVGGFFERMVKSVKHCLKKVIGNARLSFHKLLTVLVEVEGTLNSRPHNNNPSGEVLPLSHLIRERRLESLPKVTEPEEFGQSGATYTRRHKYLV